MDNASDPLSAQRDVNSPGATSRPRFLGFVRDAETATVLAAAFSRVNTRGNPFRVASFQSTLQTLAKMTTPEVLLLDISGEDQPLNALMSLSEVVDPDTKVLLIGEERKLSFYRLVVHTMGVAEYIAKPLTSDAIIRHLLPYVDGDSQKTEGRRAGRLIAVTGVRGGVGTTTIDANVAWIIGNELHRHAMLLDTDMHTGTAAFVVNAGASNGLAEALDTPGRIDEMLVERVAVRAGQRFHMLASHGSLEPQPDYRPGSGQVLARHLETRYNVVIADCGARHLPFAQDILASAHQHVIVLDPSLMAIRNLERLAASWDSAPQTPRPILILNQAGMPNSLRPAFMEEKIGKKFDIVIPNLRQIVPDAENHGHMAASIKGPFHDAIRKLADQLTATPAKAKPTQPRLTA